ncbi:MAG: threonine--tRNA ligase [Planctomycetes bacterium]|nr:threonine--tRNA ligase [Planctomycetota bacterium]
MPDGTTKDVSHGATTADVAELIGPGLARKAIAGRVQQNGNSRVVDLHQPLPGDCDLTVLTATDESAASLLLLRHSAAHVMAEAICHLFPKAKLVYGPPLDDGFYYDVDLDQSITPDDFPRIEQEMTRIVKENRTFSRYELPRAEAMTKLGDEGNRYKIDNAGRAEGDSLSFYVTGERRGVDFEDLCRGPHIPATGIVKAFKIRQVSRSHYRGDVNDQPLQRIYGTAFFKKTSLSAYLERLEEAKRRDHRVIGKELDLFSISERVGSGLILWLPKGTIIRTELQNYLTEEMRKLDYEFVMSPHIGQLDLYRTSGHYPYYEDSQYPAMFETDRGKAIQAILQYAKRLRASDSAKQEESADAVKKVIDAFQTAWGTIEGLSADPSLDELVEALYAATAHEQGYLLRPMNCPHHIQIYAARHHSYRDLPVRLAEYGTVYRFEQSGEISGLTRVRGFTTDDAHLFCTPEQVQDELLATVKLTRKVLEVLGLTDYSVRVGLRDAASDKYVGSDENWEKAEKAILAAARQSGVEFVEEVGEAAFYGPKIDFVVKDCIGRSWQLGTVQVDYNSPERFDLSYVGRDNTPHRPVMIHRAPFGSMERFVGILIEHFAGAFPLWLSPVQVAVATVSEKSVNYARQVIASLKEVGLRVELDAGDEKIGPKKHRLRAAKVNYILVVGEQEAADATVNVNDRDGKNIGNMSLQQFVDACCQEVATKGGSCLSTRES